MPCAYDEDHTRGIPIVAIAEIPDEYILKLYPGEFLIETREEFAKKDPALDEIIRRYFIDDDWRCTRQ